MEIVGRVMNWTFVDWLIAGFGALVGVFVVVSAFGLALLIRGFIRWVCGNNDHTTQSKLSTRTHPHDPTRRRN